MPVVKIPDYNAEVELPDDMPEDQMTKILQRDFPPLAPQKVPWYSSLKAQGAYLASSFLSAGAAFQQKINDMILMGEKNQQDMYFKTLQSVYKFKNDDVETYMSTKLKGSEQLQKTLDGVVDLWRRNATEFETIAKNSNPSVLDEIIGTTIGGAPAGVAEFMLGIPYAFGSGVADAFKKGDPLIVGGVKEGFKRYMLGKIFEGASLLKKPYAVTATGTTFGLQTLSEGGSWEDALKAGGSGLLLGVTNKSGNRSVKDVMRDLKAQVAKNEGYFAPPEVRPVTPSTGAKTEQEIAEESKKTMNANAETEESSFSTSTKVDETVEQQKKAAQESLIQNSEERIVELTDKLSKGIKENNSAFINEFFRNIQTTGDAHRVMDILIKDKMLQDELSINKKMSLQEIEQASREAAKAIADETGYSLNPLREMFTSFKDMLPRLQAFKDIMVASNKRLMELLEKAESPNATEMDKYAFMAHTQYQLELEGLMKGSQESVSRMLNSFRIKHEGNYVDFSDVSMSYDTNKQVKIEVDKLRQRVPIDEVNKLMAKVRERANKGSKIAETNKYLHEIKGSKFWNAMVEISNTWLLGSPPSHIANFVGDVIKPFVDTAQSYTAAAIGSVFQRSTPNRVTFGEANARAIGMLSSAFDSFVMTPVVGLAKATKGVVKAGAETISNPPTIQKLGKSFVDVLKDIRDFPEKLENYLDTTGIDPTYTKGMEASSGSKIINSNYLRDSFFGKVADAVLMGESAQNVFWKTVDVLGSVERDMSYGMLTAVDRPFKRMHYNAELAANVYRAAIQRGFTTEAEMKTFIDETTQRVIAYRDNVPIKMNDEQFKLVTDIHDASIKNARAGTWATDMKGIGKSFEYMLNNYPAMRFFGFRFFKTPVNLLKEAGSLTPVLPAVFEQTRSDLIGKNGPEAQAKAFAKQLLGVIMYTGFYQLIKSGMFHGSHPEDQRKALLEAGIPEYALKTGDTHIEIKRVDPYVMPLAFMADVMNAMEYMDKGRASEVTEMLVTAFANSVFSKTWLTQLGTYYEFLLDKKKNKEKLIGTFITPDLPFSGLTKYITGNDDPVMREAKTIWEMTKKIYAPSSNRPQLDWLGNFKENNKTKAGNIVSKTKDSPIYRESIRLGMHVEDMDDTIELSKGKIKLTPDEHWQMRRNLEDKFKFEDTLNKLVQSKSYAAIKSDMAKEDLIKTAVSRFHTAAKYDFIANTPDVKDAIRKDLEQQAAILTNPQEAVNIFSPKRNRHITR